MRRPVLVVLFALACTPGLADDRVLIKEEESDAQSRTREELRGRIRDLETQHQASRSIAEKQQLLIEALQAEIQALQEKGNERSNPEE